MIIFAIEIASNYHKLITELDQELIQKCKEKLNKLA